jgi:hypothetical protein
VKALCFFFFSILRFFGSGLAPLAAQRAVDTGTEKKQ